MPISTTLRFLVTTCVVLAGYGLADAADAAYGTPDNPANWRGSHGTGVFPGGDLVTHFYDIPADAPADVMTRDWSKTNRRNRLKSIAAKAGFSDVTPGSRKNIVWKTTPPYWGNNSPVALGDRVFVMCDEGWKSDAPALLCLAIEDGTILWQQQVDHLDAWPVAKAKEAKRLRALHLERLRESLKLYHAAYYNNSSHRWNSKPNSEEAIATAKQAGWQFDPPKSNHTKRKWVGDPPSFRRSSP